MPEGDNSFRVKNKTDLTIYSSSLCALMLQVYYRYLPSYSIAENSELGKNADDLDLGGIGLISRLPGGADPMASVILGVGTDDMPPLKFGMFNGIPQSVDAPLADGEFFKLASMRSTIAVRKIDEWPQTLQANQRIAMFFDELLPRNFKGHMRLLIGVVGTDKAAMDYQQSLEVVLNGKRLFNSLLLRNKQLIEIVIPNDIMLPYGNILQIRNNGKATLAFDAAELSSVNKVGEKLFLLAEDLSKLPADVREIFSKTLPENFELCKLSAQAENRQLLPEINEYDSARTYIGAYPASGSEYMGNEFQKHYLRQTGREIIDWIAGGGSGVKINDIMTGGRLYDSIFHVEYPAVAALKQTAKLFEGTPRKLFSQIYPKYGEIPGLFLSCAASYNAPGIATIAVARRFPIPEESELVALIPWSGETEVTIERGFLPEKSPFAGFAAKLEMEKKIISIKENTFRYSAVFPELMVLRLVRRGTPELKSDLPFYRYEAAPGIKYNHDTVKYQLPREAEAMKKYSIRQTGGFVSAFGRNATFSKIPATMPEDYREHFKPQESESLCVNFKIHSTNPKRFDSVYLPLGQVSGNPQYLVFDVFARQIGLKKRDQGSWVTLRFALCGKLYSTTVNIERWQKIVLPLNGSNPSWQHLRILEPTGSFDKKLQSISFEINGIVVYSN